MLREPAVTIRRVSILSTCRLDDLRFQGLAQTAAAEDLVADREAQDARIVSAHIEGDLEVTSAGRRKVREEGESSELLRLER